MDIDFKSLQIEALEVLYEKVEKKLRILLLNGASWQEIRYYMKFVVQLSIALNKQISLH